MSGVTVVSLNISWEANNFKNGMPSNSAIPSGKAWEAAREAWANAAASYKDDVLGPAYVKSLRAIASREPDVVLLQEFQCYEVNNIASITAAINILEGQTSKKYAVAAIDAEGGATYTAFASIVLVDEHRFEQYIDVSHAARIRLKAAFPRGRPLAAAICTDRRTHERTMIVSSHSAHRIPWDRAYTQNALNELHEVGGGGNLIWGGDFNANVKSGGPLDFGSRKVYKLSSRMQNMVDTGKWGAMVDWILTTSTKNRNPTPSGSSNTNVVRLAASDHRPVAITTTVAFIDTTAGPTRS